MTTNRKTNELHGITRFYWSSVLLFLLLSFSFTACSRSEGREVVTEHGYNLSDPVLIKLPLELDEISGIVYYPKDTSVFAINDEFGRLYKIFLNQPNLIHMWPFSGSGDYEDLALIDSNFYVLRSDGSLICFRFINRDSMYQAVYPFPFGSNNEFETLYYDSSRHKLMLICKDCETDKKEFLSCYTFDPWTREFERGPFQFDVTSIATASGETKIKFKPSAADIHPLTGELYLVSAVNDILVVADKDGRTRQVYPLEGRLYKQPEGITFTPSGTMLISNEAAEVGVANILVFPPLQKGKIEP